jgi:hypothetical protein
LTSNKPIQPTLKAARLMGSVKHSAFSVVVIDFHSRNGAPARRARALKSPKGGVREHAGRTQDRDDLSGDL